MEKTMKPISKRNRIIGVISASLGLLGLLFPLSLGAESKAPLMMAFNMWADKFFVAVSKNDGSPLQFYTQHEFSLDPSLTPDGRSLFFADNGVSQFGTILQLFQLDLESKVITQISDGTAVDEHPVCSPDGKELAFISRLAKPAQGEDGRYRVYLSDISGKDRRPADPEGATPQYFPAWSPDSKKLIYTHGKFPLPSRLLIRDLEKKTTTRLLPFYIFAYQASWSLKGDLIAYTDIVPLTNKKSIWVVKADGSDRRQITQGPDDQDPFWYPDGSKLIFSRAEGEREGGNPKRVICTVDLETRTVKKIIDLKDGSVDTPSIIALPAAGAPQQVSQSQAPAANKKQ
jgi:Tol biopolymer transport system component